MVTTDPEAIPDSQAFRTEIFLMQIHHGTADESILLLLAEIIRHHQGTEKTLSQNLHIIIQEQAAAVAAIIGLHQATGKPTSTAGIHIGYDCDIWTLALLKGLSIIHHKEMEPILQSRILLHEFMEFPHSGLNVFLPAERT